MKSEEQIKRDQKMYKDPAIQEWFHIFKRTPTRIERPIEALGEKRVFAYLMENPSTEVIADTPLGKAPMDLLMRKSFSKAIRAAEVVFFSEEMLRVLVQLQNKIQETIEKDQKFVPRKLPFPLVWFSTPTGMFDVDPNIGHIDAFLEMDSESYFGDISLPQFIPNNLCWGFLTNKEGHVICKIAKRPEFTREAMCIILEEKIAHIRTERIPRQLRKTMKKIGISSDEVIRVIELRSFEKAATSQEGGGSFEYAHQWIVRGHIRNQFFPSSNEHRLIWIDPYRKGPEDAPFMESVKVVRR